MAPILCAFALAQFETEIESASRPEGRPQTQQGSRHLGQGEMEQAGTGPDTVVTLPLGNIGEGMHSDRLAEVFRSQLRQVRRCVKCRDPKATCQKCLGIAPRAATRVQDQPVRLDVGKEAIL